MSEQSDVLKRFIRYCEVASQSNPLTADTVPSTPAQHTMAQVVAKDLEALGAEDIVVDAHAYVTAHWPASAGAENLPTLLLSSGYRMAVVWGRGSSTCCPI